MVLLALLFASAAPTDLNDAIRLQALRCGLKPDQLVWRKDADGRERADITPNGNLDGFAKPMMCLLDWASKSGVKIGFISQPPPANRLKP